MLDTAQVTVAPQRSAAGSQHATVPATSLSSAATSFSDNSALPRATRGAILAWAALVSCANRPCGPECRAPIGHAPRTGLYWHTQYFEDLCSNAVCVSVVPVPCSRLWSRCLEMALYNFVDACADGWRADVEHRGRRRGARAVLLGPASTVGIQPLWHLSF